jgi:hypothetical protein
MPQLERGEVAVTNFKAVGQSSAKPCAAASSVVAGDADAAGSGGSEECDCADCDSEGNSSLIHASSEIGATSSQGSENGATSSTAKTGKVYVELPKTHQRADKTQDGAGK